MSDSDRDNLITAIGDALDVAFEAEGRVFDPGQKESLAHSALTVIDRLRALTKWQPIETAPKDGTRVDVCFGKNRVTDVFFRRGNWAKEIGYPVVTKVFFEQPTHWMPIPTPPTTEKD
jgi:hypothetical protein